MTRILLRALFVGIPLLGPIHVSAAEDPLVRATELYLSASYDEALNVLSQSSSDPASPEGLQIAEVRLFCLLALDRQKEAREAVEALVAVSPSYKLSEERASPRVRTLFQDTRRAVLPSVVQRFYDEAKSAFDRKDPKSGALFARVLTVLDDPDLPDSTAIRDLKTVARAFRDLSEALAASPSSPPAPKVPVVPVVAEAPPAPAAGQPPVAASGESSNPRPRVGVLVPPVAISQEYPQFVVPKGIGGTLTEYTGLLELAIDEKGRVTSAVLRTPVHPRYDATLVKAALAWTYKPATQNGEPVPFTKMIRVTVR